MIARDDLRLRILHAVRVPGYASGDRVRERAGGTAAQIDEVLLDAQAAGLVTWSRFEDYGGWLLTDAGKKLNERLLAEELDRVGARDVVEPVMGEFDLLNHRIADVCTRWQLADLGIPGSPTSLAATVDELTRIADGWAHLEKRWGPGCRAFGAITTGSPQRSIAPATMPGGNGDRPRLCPPGVVRTPRGSPRHPWPRPLRWPG